MGYPCNVGFAWAGAVLVLATPAWPAGGWRIDATSLLLNAGRWPMRSVEACRDRDGSRTLGVAMVVYSRKHATMAWGHASLRVVRCVDGELVDREYEAYRLSPWNELLFRDEHAGEPFLDGSYLSDQRGAMVLFRNADPVDAGWYGDAQSRNREIYELWLDRSPDQLDAIAEGAERWYAEQLATLRAEAPLPDRFRPRSSNCTSVFQRLLGEEDPPVLPFAWLRRMDEEALLKVMRPSHALVRRWGGVPARVSRRPHPIFRWSRSIPDEVVAELTTALPDVTPLGPWSLAPAGPPRAGERESTSSAALHPVP